MTSGTTGCASYITAIRTRMAGNSSASNYVVERNRPISTQMSCLPINLCMDYTLRAPFWKGWKVRTALICYICIQQPRPCCSGWFIADALSDPPSCTLLPVSSDGLALNQAIADNVNKTRCRKSAEHADRCVHLQLRPRRPTRSLMEHNGASRFSSRASPNPPARCLLVHKLLTRRPGASIINPAQRTPCPSLGADVPFENRGLSLLLHPRLQTSSLAQAGAEGA